MPFKIKIFLFFYNFFYTNLRSNVFLDGEVYHRHDLTKFLGEEDYNGKFEVMPY